jgi:outer membrane protein TolC
MAYRQFDDLRNKIRFNIRDAYAQLEQSRQQALLYKIGIIPQATQSLQASISAYRVGKVEFLSLLDSQLTLFRYEMDYFRVLTDYQRSLARLEAESGLTLNKGNAAMSVADN